MNNICIYAEVIALARFFLGFLLSPQILNIQLPSPDVEPWSRGCSDSVCSLGLCRWRKRAGEGGPTWYVWATGVGGQRLGLPAPADSSMAHFGMATLGLRDKAWF